MIEVTFKDTWLTNYYRDPYRSISLGSCKLSDLEVSVSLFQEATVETLLAGTSPTTGTYEVSWIKIEDGVQMSVTIPESDYGVELYKTIYVLYTDLETGQEDVAFMVTLGEATLRRTVNLVDIKGFSPRCQVEYHQTKDTKRLEGRGQGRYTCISKNTCRETDSSYITLDSFKDFNQEIRCTDSTYHLDTTIVNEFGLKIY